MPFNYSFSDWTCSTWSHLDFDQTSLWLTPSTARILHDWWPMESTDWSLGPGVQKEKVRGVNIRRCNGWVGWRVAGKKMWRTQKQYVSRKYVSDLSICSPKFRDLYCLSYIFIFSEDQTHISPFSQSSRCATQRIFQPSQKCIFTWMRHIIPLQLHISHLKRLASYSMS